MERPSESTRSRRALLAGGTGLIALAAGCLGDEFGGVSDPSGDDGTDDEGDGNESDSNESGNETDGDENDENDGNETGGEGDGFSYETYAYQHPQPPSSPEAWLFLEEDDADDWLEERESAGGSSDALADFVADTPFDDGLLVALEAGGSDLCHEMVLDAIDLEDEEQEGDDERLAVDASVDDGQDEAQACAEQITAVGLLVRVTFEDDPVTELSATIVDQDGQEHGFGIGVDSASEEGSDRK
ncbi:hypothetical protein SAMN05444422_103176 [Halobiforma haloterrestris]|uniref:Uncharacterized protein n=1 Tax=Natronobacterium haloterrestre TaxID=148448 RepID=A0A1I1F675_NATHA|nr:hypothetical protein [Halobiforma haloterrestris]SFB94456.1 hypothetical protein SAMN05444422_103176 [Halobiforma haloterrestris]